MSDGRWAAGGRWQAAGSRWQVAGSGDEHSLHVMTEGDQLDRACLDCTQTTLGPHLLALRPHHAHTAPVLARFPMLVHDHDVPARCNPTLAPCYSTLPSDS